MKALVYDGTLRLTSVPIPKRKAGEVLVRVQLAGICNTDHEITQGYMPDFKGILGHEFIGIAEEADNKKLIGKRVSAEINCSCKTCSACTDGLGRHCAHRTVLGILNRDGAFAEYIAVPQENIFEIPEAVSDENAVFVEPLAAALEIHDQISLNGKKVLLIGDGKLALLIAHTAQMANCTLTVVGKHKKNLAHLAPLGVTPVLLSEFEHGKFDIVIEASGNPAALALATQCVRPRGTIVLKSTYAGASSFNPSSLVVNEISLIGSRCGRFSHALKFMETFLPDFSPLISRKFTLDNAMEAFAFSQRPGVLKVLLTNI